MSKSLIDIKKELRRKESRFKRTLEKESFAFEKRALKSSRIVGVVVTALITGFIAYKIFGGSSSKAQKKQLERKASGGSRWTRYIADQLGSILFHMGLTFISARLKAKR